MKTRNGRYREDRTWHRAMSIGGWVILGLSIVFAVVIVAAANGWIR